MAAGFTKFYSAFESIMEKKHDFGSDALVFIFTNTAPTLTWTQKSNITGEISSGGGYTAGTGLSCGSVSSSSQTTGSYSLVLTPDPFTFTPSASVGPFQYMIMVNDTSTNDLLIGFYDLGAPVTLTSGIPFELDYNAAGTMTGV